MKILIWLLALLLIGTWTLLGWGAHALLTHGPAWLDGLPDWAASLPGIGVLEAWWPDWQAAAAAVATVFTTLTGWLGAAGSVLVWAVWGLGTLLVLALAALLSWAVKRFAPPPAAA
ncbi:MAG: hypothetical protein JNM33_02700 [Rubrivivax sp.]|nr:hypothetical protein [Rubrivivax sp.]